MFCIYLYVFFNLCAIFNIYYCNVKMVGNNVLSTQLLTTLQTTLESYFSNTAISTVFFTSKSPDIFSAGLFPNFYDGDQESNSTSSVIKDSTKKTIKNMDEIRYLDDNNSLNRLISIEQLVAVNKLAVTINKFSKLTDKNSNINKKDASSIISRKVSISVYGGRVSCTAYGAFAGSKYKLGTQHTELCIDEIGKKDYDILITKN